MILAILVVGVALSILLYRIACALEWLAEQGAEDCGDGFGSNYNGIMTPDELVAARRRFCDGEAAKESRDS